MKQAFSLLDDPLLDPTGAGQLLRLTVARLKKWRQLACGPEYIRYGKNRAVRYRMSALMRFRFPNTCPSPRLR
jgi:hypothetical protein